MAIYQRVRANYRKIYEQHYGPIPKDNLGRSYHIHHIDGDHKNNDPSNLVAVSPEDHYYIHLDQGDYEAARRIAVHFLNLTNDEITELRRLNGKSTSAQLLAEGRHPFTGGELQRLTGLKRVADGTHNFLDGEISRQVNAQRVKDGTHNFLGGDLSRKTNARLIAEGTHHFLNSDNKRHWAAKAIASGTHASQIERTCPHCGIIGKGPTMKRWHFNKCKAFQPVA